MRRFFLQVIIFLGTDGARSTFFPFSLLAEMLSHSPPRSRRLQKCKRPGSIAKWRSQLNAFWTVTGGFCIRRCMGCHSTPQFRKTACYMLVFNNMVSL